MQPRQQAASCDWLTIKIVTHVYNSPNKQLPSSESVEGSLTSFCACWPLLNILGGRRGPWRAPPPAGRQLLNPERYSYGAPRHPNAEVDLAVGV